MFVKNKQNGFVYKRESEIGNYEWNVRRNVKIEQQLMAEKLVFRFSNRMVDYRCWSFNSW